MSDLHRTAARLAWEKQIVEDLMAKPRALSAEEAQALARSLYLKTVALEAKIRRIKELRSSTPTPSPEERAVPEHATVRNVEGGYQLECAVCDATELVRPPLPVREFVRRTRAFVAAHEHPVAYSKFSNARGGDPR